MARKEILLFTLLLLQNANSAVPQDEEDDSTMFRLRKTLVPENYDLVMHIEPDLFFGDFGGNVNITLQLNNATSPVENIYLHADASYITITYANLNEVNNCTFENLNNHIVKFSCGNVTEETNSLYIEFNGQYSISDGYGLVNAGFTDQNRKQYLIESYFEPTYARRAFPCFDEPDFKATFSIQITVPTGFTALTNSITQDYYTFSDEDHTTTIYQPTPKISTYLVSIFVSKFNEVSTNSTNEEYSIKFLTRPGFEDLTSKVAGVHYSQIMSVLSNFTGQSFEDIGDIECYQVAIPDYYSEHMGNFGLFAYKERDLLDEGDKTTTKVTQNILQAMAYKISQEWFGGEVSTTWWSDFWANDAVPTYLKYVIPNQIVPKFELTNQFVVEVVQKSMLRDAMPFAESLSSNEADVGNEWGIESKLDDYTLLKGATLLHMINFMVGGEDQFKANLQVHLQNRTGLDTDGENILEDLTKHDGIQDLLAASESWAFTPGFPLLSVKIDKSTDDEETLAFSQKRFIYPVDNTSTFSDEIKWTIPISYTYSSKKYFDTMINVYYAPNIELFINIYKDDWVLFNIQGRLHYRVNYEEELWRRIITAFHNETERAEIHVLSRAQVIDDIFNIARIGEVDYSLVFELADSLIYETEYYPWYSALNAFSYLLGKMKDDHVEERLKLYILSLMNEMITIPGTTSYLDEDETHIDVLKRTMMLDWACKLGHLECINYATEQFANYKENQTSMVDYNLRAVILCNGLRYSENVTVDWRFLWSLYQSSSSVHEQYDILQALGCAEDEDILGNNYLIRLATPLISTEVKRQDTMAVFESVFASSAGINAALSFIQSSPSYIQFIFNYGTNEIHILSDMMLMLAEEVSTDDQLQQLQNILSSDVFNGYDDFKTRVNTLATVNNYWTKQYQDIIDKILPDISTTSTEESTVTTEYTTISSPSSTEETTEPTDTDEPTTTKPSTTTESSSEKIFLFSHIIVVFCVLILII